MNKEVLARDQKAFCVLQFSKIRPVGTEQISIAVDPSTDWTQSLEKLAVCVSRYDQGGRLDRKCESSK